MMLTEKKKAPLKASTVLKVTPTPSSSTKSTKTPILGPHRKSLKTVTTTTSTEQDSHHDHHPRTANLRTRVLVKSPQ